jgi:hypothetical protein
MEPRTDPPPPEDGTCAVCGEPREKREVSALYETALRGDSFCSATCARAWWGVPLPEYKRPPRRAYVSPLPPAA